MKHYLKIERTQESSRLLVYADDGTQIATFLPPSGDSQFLYIGSEVGVSNIQDKPVVIVNFYPGHYVNGHPDWQFLVDVANEKLIMKHPWH